MIEDLKNIINTDLEYIQLEGYVNDAQTFAASIGITSETVVKYLAAHLIAFTRQRPVKSEEAGGAKVVYEGVFGAGLSSTPYGQTALDMDATGALKKLTKSKLYLKAL